MQVWILGQAQSEMHVLHLLSLTTKCREFMATTSSTSQSSWYGWVVQVLVDFATVLLIFIRFRLLYRHERWNSEHKCDLSLSGITIPSKYIISLYSDKANLKCCITKYFALQSFTHLHPKEQPFRSGLELQHIHASCSALVHPLELTVIREYYQILKHKIKTLISI